MRFISALFKKKTLLHTQTQADLLLVMKSIMSCSSLSSIMRSLGLLLRVLMINWCRSMPVESVYSWLDSETTHEKWQDNKNKNTKTHTAILNTPGELHLNSGTESNFITFYLLFLASLLWDNHHTHAHTRAHIHTPLDNECFFGSVLFSCSSSLHEVLSLSWQLDEMFVSWDAWEAEK